MATSAQVADLMLKRLNLRGVDRYERFDRPRHPGRIVTVESTGPKVAALYVDPNGVYANLPNVEVWDAARDARLYAGPWPVVAHPPCTRWCRFAPGLETRFGLRVGDDGGCFAAALAAVRKYSGVLEHPAYSLAWPAHGLPEPQTFAGWTLCLDDPGAVAYVEQGRYGHATRKATWLYAVGIELRPLRWGRVNDDSLGSVSWGSYLYKTGRQTHMQGRPRVTATISNGTPVEFRDALLGLVDARADS